MNYMRNLLKIMAFRLRDMLPDILYLTILCHVSYIINKMTINKIVRKLEVKHLSDLEHRSYKKSDTLFILGSGNSINDLTEEQWSIIKRHDSVGFNFWLIHEFIPTYYVFEENKDYSRNNAFYELLKEKEDLYKKVPIIVKDAEVKGVSINRIPEKLRKHIFISTDIVLTEDDPIKLAEHLGFYKRFLARKNKKSLKVILKQRATLSYLLFFAHEMGYKRIVLCGVDLYDSRFFYFDPKYKNSIKPEKDLIDGDTHPTNLEVSTNIPISKIIIMMKKYLMREKGIEILVGSKKSALYPHVNYYFEK